MQLQVPLAESDSVFAEISPDLSRCLLRVPARHSDARQRSVAQQPPPPQQQHVGELLCYNTQTRALLFAIALPSVCTVFAFDPRFGNDRVALTLLDATHGPNALAIAELHVHEPRAATAAAGTGAGRSLAASAAASNWSHAGQSQRNSPGAHLHLPRASSSSHVAPPPPPVPVVPALACPAVRVVATNTAVNRHAGALHPFLRQLLFSPAGLHIVVLALAALECRCRQARRFTRAVETLESATSPGSSTGGSADIIGIGTEILYGLRTLLAYCSNLSDC